MNWKGVVLETHCDYKDLRYSTNKKKSKQTENRIEESLIRTPRFTRPNTPSLSVVEGKHLGL